MRRKHNKIPKLHLKKGDTVRVLSGKDRGKDGRVLEVMPKKRKALVEDINMVTKHQKPSQDNPQGDRVQTEAPLYVDKLQVVDPKTGKPTHIGRRYDDGRWKRYAKVSGELID